MRNPFTMNDWELKDSISVIVVLQLVLLASAGLNSLGMPLSLIEQATGCVFLLFIPGILILRILKLHNLGSTRTLLYAVGLSIATLMFGALFVNQAYPYIGITRPLTPAPLLITLSAGVDILCLAAFFRDRTFSNANPIDLRDVLSPPTLLLCLIPFIAIFGTYINNATQNNAFLLLLIVLVALLVVLLTFKKDVPEHVYPLAIFVCVLSLLYYESLTSNFVWGWDINIEHYLAGWVVANGSWDPALTIGPSPHYNSALSIVLLAPTLSLVCGMSLVWVFKVISPLIFALVPVGLYLVFRQETTQKVAFLSAFLFLIVPQTFASMVQLPRQEIGELFLVLILMVMVDKRSPRRNALSIIFSFALIVAHYALAYIYIFMLIFVVLALALLDNRLEHKISQVRHSPSSVQDSVAKSAGTTRQIAARTITLAYVVLFVVVSQFWYIYTTKGAGFDLATQELNFIAHSSFLDFFNTNTIGAGVLTASVTSPLQDVARDMYVIVQFLIIIGIIALLLGRTRMRFDKEFSAFAAAAFLLLVVTFAVPYVYGTLGTDRLYQIALVFLTPFAVIGGLVIVRASGAMLHLPCKSNCENGFLKAFSIFLALFLLFNSGFIYEIVDKSASTAAPLNATLDVPRFNERDIAGASWLSSEKQNQLVYADPYRAVMLQSFFAPTAWPFPLNYTLARDSYVYLGSLNTATAKILVLQPGPIVTRDYDDAHKVTLNRGRLYDNGGAQVYH